MPAEGSYGHIEDQASGEVLGLWNASTDLGSMVVLDLLLSGTTVSAGATISA